MIQNMQLHFLTSSSAELDLVPLKIWLVLHYFNKSLSKLKKSKIIIRSNIRIIEIKKGIALKQEFRILSEDIILTH